MSDHSKQKALVIDNGLFSCVAEKLAESYGHVWYWTPWIEAFVRSSSLLLGRGAPNIERVDWWETVLKDADLVVFPDCYYGPSQTFMDQLFTAFKWIYGPMKPYLSDLKVPPEVSRFIEAMADKRVWGARDAEQLELDREWSKVTMDDLDIPIGDFAVVRGVDELRAYLKEHHECHIKVSFTRGDTETFPGLSKYPLIMPKVDDVANTLGPYQKEQEFICEAPIENAVEIAGDFYTVDGQFPSLGLVGIEAKSSAYCGRFLPWAKMPKQVTDNLTKLAPILKRERCRSWLSLETRVTTDGTPWVTDPCLRFGNPPGALCSLIYDNLGDILWEGAEGKCIDPKPLDEWGVQLVVHSSWSERHYQPVYYPKELARYVKLVNHTVIDGVNYVVPGPDLSSAVGSIIATGPTLEKAIKKCQEYAEEVEGLGLEMHPEALEKTAEEIGKLGEYGMSI